MNKQLKFTRKMFTLPIVGAGAIYPHISNLPDHDTVGDALGLFQLDGYRLRYIGPPWQVCKLRDEPGYLLKNPRPEPTIISYKVRVFFKLERGEMEREYVKGGFLYDTPDQLYEWLRG